MQAPFDFLPSFDTAQDLSSPNMDVCPALKYSHHPPTPTDMVTLPSSPNSLFADSPHTTANTIVSQLPTPSTPDNECSDTAQPQRASGDQLTPMIVPAKRGYKSHVPSACLNCRKAHLACDVSRPCKRCVVANKESSCQDVKHKKRGRPRLHEAKRPSTGEYGSSMVFEDGNGPCRMIQTGTFTMATSDPHRRHRPSPTAISFIHEPMESFRGGDQRDSWKKDGTSPFKLNQQALRDPEPPPSHLLVGPSSNHLLEDSTITMFLSMDMCCARVSDEVSTLWGYNPQDLVHRSMYGLISSHDKDRLSRLHKLLLDNITDISCQHDSTSAPEEGRPLPNGQLATSPVFYETHPDRLSIAAQGSDTYSDTLHFKKLSGEHILFEVAVYLGGGLGADLTAASTFEQLYIVAEIRKHQYKITPYAKRGSSFVSTLPPASVSYHPPRFLSSSSPGMVVHASENSISSTNSSSSGSKQSVPRRMFKPIAPYFGGRFGPHLVRQGTLPGHFTTNSQLNTVSLSPKSTVIPKVNIAPSLSSSPLVSSIATSQKQQTDKRVTDRLFPAHRNGTTSSNVGGGSGGSNSRWPNGGPYFRRIAAATSPSPTTSIGHESNSNPYSTLAYRKSSPTTLTTPYTHPALQYFLQTPSSTLNAAASAAQGNPSKGGPVDAMADNDRAVGKTDANRKAEMSIRSLLC